MLLVWFIIWWFNGFPSVLFASANGADSWAIWLVVCVAFDIYGSHTIGR